MQLVYPYSYFLSSRITHVPDIIYSASARHGKIMGSMLSRGKTLYTDTQSRPQWPISTQTTS